MTLLQEIQNASTSTEARVADLLRKCKILAVRLKNPTTTGGLDNIAPCLRKICPQ
jgi:hypothetical protein